jgi:hypothetical protein
MPYRGQSQQRGGGGYGGYRYQQATPSQYESFFNPVPIEFMQERIERRQGAYDTAFAGILESKEKFLQEQVALNDVQRRDQLIQGTLEDIDNVVYDKFGGDYGRAAKDIGKQILKTRGDEFWAKSKFLSEQQTAEREFINEKGSQGYIYNSALGRSTFDPETGQYASAQDLTFRGEELSDYAASIQKQFAGMDGSTINAIMQQSGMGGVGQFTSWEGITGPQLDTLASNPDVINAFLATNQDFVNTRKHQGMKMEQIMQEASSLIKGEIIKFAHINRKDQFINQPGYADMIKAQADTGYRPSANRQPFMTDTSQQVREHSRRMGEGIVASPRMITGGGVMSMNVAFPEERTQAELDASVGAREEKLNTYWKELQDKYDEFDEINPETGKPYTREETFTAYNNYLQWQQEQASLTWNLKLEDSARNAKSNLASNINAAEFRVDGLRTTGDVAGRKNVATELGYPTWQGFVDAFEGGEIEVAPKVDFVNNSLSMTIPGRRGRGQKMKPVELHFTPDVQVGNILNTGHWVTNAMYDDKDYDGTEDKFIYDIEGRPTGWRVSVEGDADIINPENTTKQIIIHNPTTKQRYTMPLDQFQADQATKIDQRMNSYQGFTGNKGKN